MRRRDLLAVASLLALALAAAPVGAGWRRDNEEECARLDARLKDVGDRRRAGYSAKEGRRLKVQRDKLERQRREQCR